MKARRRYGNGLTLDKWGNYIVRFRVAGRGSPEIRKKLGKITYTDAVTQAAIEKGKAKARRTTADPRLTFGDLADAYLSSEGDRLSARGKALAEMMIRCHLKPFFKAGETPGGMRVEAIRAADVEAYRKARRVLVGKKKRRQSDRPISPATFNREWSLIRAILNFGERTERIERNPIRRGAVRLLREEPRRGFFEPDEWKAFHDAAEAEAELRQTVPFWRVLLLTGRRISELAALRWRDVDLERGAVRFYQTKTDRPVTLPLAGELAALLKALGRFRGIKPDAPVFILADGSPMTVPFLQVAFRRIVKAAEMKGGGVHGKLTPHSVRHTAATWARREGVPLDRIAAVLGHADLRMTLRTYAHVGPADLASPLDVLAGVERRAREEAGEKKAAQ